jgi:phenylalanyl-tRNA synthetase beta chain
MLAVWSWLKELVEFPREVTAEEAAAALTGAGLEVEEFRRVGEDFSGVIIAEVAAKEKHPNADKLTLVKVRSEAGGTTTDVICGAPNVPEPGGKVLWARPGAVLPGGFKIGSKKLKGIESAGMLCSESELGLSDSHDGIVVLTEPNLTLGADAAEALGLKDVVFDLCIPANRADALGHLGLARELAALLGGRAVAPNASLDEFLGGTANPVKVTLEDASLCPRYVARTVVGLKVAPSPMWMQQRLRNVGVRPISNLVDVTNYVMFELGQPLHAFDAARIETGEIAVRLARKGERLVTLDEQERELLEGDLLITDGRGPIALAGVMGGANTEVGGKTSDVILESASFDPMSVRRTSRRLGLHSEASHRFERRVDPNGCAFGADRAARLLAELGGGKVVDSAVDVYPTPQKESRVVMRLSRCAALTGIELERESIEGVLSRQGLGIEKGGADEVVAVVPTFRSDIEREVDVIEEVVRIYGFDRVPASLPRLTQAPRQRGNGLSALLRAAFAQVGFCETVTYGFTSKRRIEALGLPAEDPRSNPIPVTNPLSAELGWMRTTLWSNLLAAVERNQKRDVRDVALYELGTAFLSDAAGKPEERSELCALLCGRQLGWLSPGPERDFFDLKGRMVAGLRKVYGDSLELSFSSEALPGYLHPGVAAIVEIGGKKVGEIGEIHPEVAEAFDLSDRVCGLCLKVDELPFAAARQMRSLPRYPAITRDLSMFLDEGIQSEKVSEIIKKGRIELLVGSRVLEDYRDPAHVPSGKKGMLWSMTYRSPERTLTDAEVDAIHGPLEEKILSELAATRR